MLSRVNGIPLPHWSNRGFRGRVASGSNPASDAVTIGASRSRDVSAAEANASAVPRLEARRIGIREMVRAGTRAGGVPRSRE